MLISIKQDKVETYCFWPTRLYGDVANALYMNLPEHVEKIEHGFTLKMDITGHPVAVSLGRGLVTPASSKYKNTNERFNKFIQTNIAVLRKTSREVDKEITVVGKVYDSFPNDFLVYYIKTADGQVLLDKTSIASVLPTMFVAAPHTEETLLHVSRKLSMVNFSALSNLAAGQIVLAFPVSEKSSGIMTTTPAHLESLAFIYTK